MERFKAELVDSIFVDENKVEHELTTGWVVFDTEKTVSYAVATEDTANELAKLLNKMYCLLLRADYQLGIVNGLYASDEPVFKNEFRLNYDRLLDMIKRV